MNRTGLVGTLLGASFLCLGIGTLAPAASSATDSTTRINRDDGLRAMAWTSPETDNTRSLAWGDWDNDGDLDLAVGNEDQPNRVYVNSGEALTLVWSSTETDDTQSVAWGDWDNDGDLDLAVGNFSQANRVYENTGGALTLAWTSSSTDATQSVAWGDWDNDGDLDLAVGNRNAPNRVYENSGGALSSVWLSVESDVTYGVAWGDWDSDGDLDLAVANTLEANRVYENTGGDLTLAWSSTEVDASTSVAWADINDDGNSDLAVGNYRQPSRIYTSSGSAMTLYSSTTEVNSTWSVAWGNWDEDPHLELATGNSGQPTWVYNISPGSMIPFYGTPLDDRTADVAFADFDGDGSHDLIEGNDGTSNRIYRAFGAAITGGEPLSTSIGIAWGDLDGDGDLDLASGTNSSLGVYVNTDGQLNRVLFVNDSLNIRSVAWGDWDGDGDLDLAVGSYNRPNRVYENTGGALAEAWIATAARLTHCVAWGDWDGDADLDLVVGNYGEPDQVYENTGGDLSEAWIAPAEDYTNSVAWGDWDSDGDLDLAEGIEFGPSLVYENTGGHLTLAWIAPQSEWTMSVAWGDWDGDGDLDLAAGNYFNSNIIYENTGGALTEAWTSVESENTTTVAWGDWDGDGEMDLLVNNDADFDISDDTSHVYMRALGHFLPMWDYSSPSGFTYSYDAAWGDVDADGDLDIFRTGSGTADLLFENPRLSHPGQLPETPVHPVALDRPGTTDTAYLFSSAECLTSPVTIPYTLHDEQSDRAWSILPQYSLVGGGHWLPASEGPGGDGTSDLAASPEGTPHTFSWDYAADTSLQASAVFRITVVHQAPDHAGEPIQNGGLSAITPPFRINVDGDGDGWNSCEDNCPLTVNPGQEDADADGVGDVCDNCPDGYNPDQQLAGVGDRVWRDTDEDGIQELGEFGIEAIHVILLDAGMSVVDSVSTDKNGRYAFNELCPGDYTIDVVPPAGMTITLQDAGDNDAFDSDVDPVTGQVTVALSESVDRTDVDAGLFGECLGPGDSAFVYDMMLTDDEHRYPVLSFSDPNSPELVTGYNIYRVGDANMPHESWRQVGFDATDMIPGHPGNQWIDTSSAVPASGIWFYQVAPFNTPCDTEGPW